jgi:hypothetical protein
LQIALELATALEDAGIPYAVGGALALAYHGVPRGTKDIDLNIFLAADEARGAFEVLRAAGATIDIDAAVRRAAERGDAAAIREGVRIDLFVSSIPLHEEAARRRQRVTLASTPIWILSAEDLFVLKLLFFRGKDIEDCKRMVAALGAALDAGYVRRQLVDHVGGDDQRVAELAQMLATLSATE